MEESKFANNDSVEHEDYGYGSVIYWQVFGGKWFYFVEFKSGTKVLCAQDELEKA